MFVRLSCCFLLLFMSHAEAHRFAPSLFKLTETAPLQFSVVWKTPIEGASNVALKPLWPDVCQIVSESPVVREGTGTVSSWTLDCSALGSLGLVGQSLSVSGLAVNQASAMVMLSLIDGRYYQGVINDVNAEFIVPEKPSTGTVLSEYPVLGAEHIWEGPDHLMFVFGLLLLVGGGARLIWTITAFTVGHSITLAVVTIGVFTYPVALVEFVIALSIFLVALELAQKRNADTQSYFDRFTGLFEKYPWWLAGGFGLLHGMGFAGALAEIGLPQNNVPLALFAFNVGIEMGQIAFVLLMLVIWRFARQFITVEPARLLPVPVYILGGLSAMWCIERGLEVLG